MDFPLIMHDTDCVPAQRAGSGDFPIQHFMIKRPEATAPSVQPRAADETEPQRFERILSRAEFKPLKAVFENLGLAIPAMLAAIITTNSCQMFLGKLGYRVNLVKQIHEQDCYSRLGPDGGIRAVLPVHDIATYSTLVVLVNFDSTVTTTSNAVDFYDDLLAAFKSLLMNKSGDAA
jgi:hypothetical protein